MARCCAACWKGFSGCATLGPRLRVAGKSGISQAWTRLGSEPLRQLHDELVGPVAIAGTRGAWYRGWRLVSLDGSTLDVADNAANEAAFKRPGSIRGLMHEAALKAGQDPDRLSYLHAVRVVRRKMAAWNVIPPSAKRSASSRGTGGNPRRARRLQPQPPPSPRRQTQNEQVPHPPTRCENDAAHRLEKSHQGS
jgi:hypothetical protein